HRRRPRAAAHGRIDAARRHWRAQEDDRGAAGSDYEAGREGRKGQGDRVVINSTMLIALGVTGGIGAYKAVEVARGLQQRGHAVAAIMTRSARKFVGEVTFEAITRRPVITDQFARGANADIEHIALATDIGLLLVAPATANTIGKPANGLAD